jgi:hypothetical protein
MGFDGRVLIPEISCNCSPGKRVDSCVVQKAWCGYVRVVDRTVIKILEQHLETVMRKLYRRPFQYCRTFEADKI